MAKKKKKQQQGKKTTGSSRRREKDDSDEGLAVVTDKLLNLDESMVQIREHLIASLGEGYDDKSLLAMDQRLAAHFFKDDDSEFGDEHGKDDKEDIGPPPTAAEKAHYKKSLVKRQTFLLKATTTQATVDSMSGNDDKNLSVYEDLFEDIITYRYAWFGVIFLEDRDKLLLTSRRLMNLAWLKLERINNDEDLDEALEVLELFDETKDIFQTKINGKDLEDITEAGDLEYEAYELNYSMAERLVVHSRDSRKDEACHYFQEALMSEDCYQYEDRYCANLLEIAIGRKLSLKDIQDIALDEKQDDYFYYDCLLAKLEGREGSVMWERVNKCEMCGACDNAERGRKLLLCARCKQVSYCSKVCQKEDWKCHKLECGNKVK